MIEGRPSRTALTVATRRAIHQLVDRPLVFDDPLALRILGPDGEARARAAVSGAAQSRFGRTLRTFLVVRSRLAEELLADAVRAGATQYVVLGAGLDTFAYRNPFPQLRVFEIDFPSTQAWKCELLDRTGIGVPANVTFAPCDFARESAADALRRAGIDESKPVFCSWLGVSMYLRREAILETVRAMLPLVRGSGGMVFDYFAPASTLPFVSRILYSIIAPAFRRRVARAGEPFLSSWIPADLAAALVEAGARDVVNHSPRELANRYLTGRTDGLRMGPAGHIVAFRG
jgi:methyltransferase (TIGR00027 family)